MTRSRRAKQPQAVNLRPGPVSCGQCKDRGWYDEAGRRARCALCYRVPPAGVRLGRTQDLNPDLPKLPAEDPYSPKKQPVGYIDTKPCRAVDRKTQTMCLEKTNCGKPYCKRHLFLMPYPTRVHRVVVQGEWEVQLAKLGKEPPSRGIKAAEIVTALRLRGPIALARLAGDIGLIQPGAKHAERETSVVTLMRFLSPMIERQLLSIVQVEATKRYQARTVVELRGAGWRWAASLAKLDLADLGQLL